MPSKIIPITIFTGFLGSGKTTLIKSIIEKHSNLKFGLIINEFGEVGIDGELIKTATSGEQIIEISNGCLCCVVRSDLQQAVDVLIKTNQLDYIIIETSGLAEPAPVAQTFLMDNLNGKVRLDSVVCVIDCENFALAKETYQITLEQLEYADIVVLNKQENSSAEQISEILKLISHVNPDVSVLKNDSELDTNLLIDTNQTDLSKYEKQADLESKPSDEHHHDVDSHDHDKDHDHDENHEHHHDHHEEEHHHHEHETVDEVVFVTNKMMDPNKLDNFFQHTFPAQVVRAKGFLKLKEGDGGMFLFQMVGARKYLQPYVSSSPDFDKQTSRIVFIGKQIPKQFILSQMEDCIVD